MYSSLAAGDTAATRMSEGGACLPHGAVLGWSPAGTGAQDGGRRE
jgi:hypothetical protein